MLRKGMWDIADSGVVSIYYLAAILGTHSEKDRGLLMMFHRPIEYGTFPAKEMKQY